MSSEINLKLEPRGRRTARRYYYLSPLFLILCPSVLLHTTYKYVLLTTQNAKSLELASDLILLPLKSSTDNVGKTKTDTYRCDQLPIRKKRRTRHNRNNLNFIEATGNCKRAVVYSPSRIPRIVVDENGSWIRNLNGLETKRNFG